MTSSFKQWANTTMCVMAVLCMLAVWSCRPVAAQVASEGAQVDADSLKKEIEKLRNEKEFEAKRVEEMRQEREQFVKEIRRVEGLNQKYTKEIEDVRAQMAAQEQSFGERLKKLEGTLPELDKGDNKTAKAESNPAPVISPFEVEKQANDILQKGGDLDPEDEKFKEELARAHYNMGNVYYERGEYQRSVVEYYQAVDLMPYDADAHYNLAYVSGEYIGDQETALKHYQWYLYLKPNATDRKLVEEKMVQAKLHGRSKVNTRIDKPVENGQMNVGR
jgi:tetratricopeptide (TPR) repeat protein